MSDESGAASREPTALFVNTASRTGLEGFHQAEDCLRQAGVRLVERRAVEDPDVLPGLVRDAVFAGVTRILVGGGDGTLSAAAAELCGRDVRLGVLPLGTGNDFARSLHIPLQLPAACEVALRGAVRPVDVGVVNGRVFLNAASVGLSTAVTRRLTFELKQRFGRAAFAVAAAGEAFTHDPFEVELETGDQRLRRWTHQVVVGNGRYHGGGQLLSPEASHQDRLLDVYLIGTEETAGRLKDLWNLFRVATLLHKGRHLELPWVQHLRVRSVRVTATPPQEVDVDGELLGTTPATFEVRPGALQVLAPVSGGPVQPEPRAKGP